MPSVPVKPGQHPPVPAAAGRSYLLPLILITSLFFMWGVANNLNDILIRQFKKAFELSDLQSGLVQSAFYLGYFLLAVPAALFMRRFSYKAGILLGLVLYGTGALLFYPAAEIRVYGVFLGALFVIASGLAFLETAANPYVIALGPPESAAFRLNLAQSFNPIGAISGILIGRNFIFSGVEYSPEQLAAMPQAALEAYYAAEARAVQGPYLAVGGIVLLWALLILLTRFPAVRDEARADTPAESWVKLLKIKHFRNGVIAQFFYVGAQVGIWSYLIRYTQMTLPGTPEKIAADYLTLALAAFMAGRFIGTALMRRVRPVRLMLIFGLVNVLLCLIAVTAPGWWGLAPLMLTSLFMSVMFPTIFATGLDGLGSSTKLGSSMMVMAIIGGAVLTALMGYVSDSSSIRMAMLVPAVCFGVVAWYAGPGSKRTAG
ncbi:MAG: L-fucose:H+ symporter permease [Bacteroidia bacterium]|nr:L-fucose:H+ symporter permease [Bacteroidia bacterium]